MDTADPEKGLVNRRRTEMVNSRRASTPKKGPRSAVEVMSLQEPDGGSPSVSHTINGHSVILRITYKGFSFLFSGDLNDEAERALTRAHNRGELNLQADVFKAPHHGSADYSGAFLQAVSPVISVVSSGDENARKEFIHPRATLVGALGKYSRLEEPWSSSPNWSRSFRSRT